jgi:hypothetical protein
MQQHKVLMLSLSKHERGCETEPLNFSGGKLTNFSQLPET